MKPELQDLLIDQMFQIKVRTQSKKSSTFFLKNRLFQLQLDGKDDTQEAKFIKIILERQEATSSNNQTELSSDA